MVDAAPNIVFIVFDDVGFSDFGCYGSEIDTPNIDRLAANGLRYTNYHTTPLCTPTRACLLTGRNHHSVGMGGGAGRIVHSAGTLAEMLRPHGYNTFATGKWHVGPQPATSAAGPYDQWPLGRGFDRFYGFLGGSTNHWVPELTYDQHAIDPPSGPGYHLTDDIVDHSIAFVRDQKAVAPEKPCFLYLCFGACHAPHQVPRTYIDKYMPVFEKGWDRTREDRLARQKRMGVVPPETQLSPRNPGVKPWADCSDDERRLFLRLQSAYAGMLDHTDERLGRFIAFMEQIDQLDNTLIFLISDNGASQEGDALGTVNAPRHINPVDDMLEYNLSHLDEIGEAQLNNNYPWGWSQASNTPLKRYKQNTHGGGVRVPLIAHWPAGLPVKGGFRRQFHHVSDLVPTVLEVLGVNAPDSINGVPQQPIEGTSLAYTFSHPDLPSAKPSQYFEFRGHRAIWQDGWKAVTWHQVGTPFEDDDWELYHLDEDFSECNDLAGEQPGRLRALVDLWWSEAGKYRVLPMSNVPPDFSGSGRQTARARWVLLPGSSHLPGHAAPNAINRSYSISAEVDMPSAGAEGMLVAHGDSCGGYALYVKGGRLVHDYNYVGIHYVVTSDCAVPSGACTLGVSVKKTGDFRAHATLLIDGQACGDVEMPRTLRAYNGFPGLDVGRHTMVPLGDYESPFAFTGTLKRIVYDLADDQRLDVEALEAAEMKVQ